MMSIPERAIFRAASASDNSVIGSTMCGSDIPVFSVIQSIFSDSCSLPRGAVIPCALEGNSTVSSPRLRPVTELTVGISHAPGLNAHHFVHFSCP